VRSAEHQATCQWAQRSAIAVQQKVVALPGRTPRERAPEAARIQAALDMHEFGVRLYRQRMHREHPQASRDEIDGMVRAWLAEPPRCGHLRLPSRERDRGIR